jgi:pyruvate dehydrogenase E1 component alpha subunit
MLFSNLELGSFLLNSESELNRNSTEKKTVPELHQILKPDGTLVQGMKIPDLTDSDLLQAYKTMQLVRALDDKLVSLQRQGRLGTYVSCAGQEASQLGAVMATNKEKDWIFPMYRDMGMIIQAGVSVPELVNRMLGNAKDLAKGRDLPNLFAWKEKRIVSFAAPIASQVALAVGFAMAAKSKKDDAITITSFGDGATSSSEFHVAMNFAGVFKAPTIFICENNQYAISVPVAKQTASKTIAVKARAYGFEGILVDGNDLLAVYSEIKKAVEKARSGEGPTLIECLTYRLAAHSTADDWKRYRESEEVKGWLSKDPITRLRRYLQDSKKVWSDKDEEQLKKEVDQEISNAIAESEKIPPPPVETLFEDVFEEMPASLKNSMKELYL